MKNHCNIQRFNASEQFRLNWIGLEVLIHLDEIFFVVEMQWHAVAGSGENIQEDRFDFVQI